MRILVVAMALCVMLGTARAGGPDVDLFVPLDPSQMNPSMQWFGDQNHGLLPGTVTINAKPYVCDVDNHEFSRQDEFIAHLRFVHHVPAQQIPQVVMRVDGQVHYGGGS